MPNHFNSSLSQSAVEKWRSNAIVKAKVSLTVTFTMTNAGEHSQNWQVKPLLISLKNVETVYRYAYGKYEHEPSKLNLRNYLMIRLPRKIGLRTTEITTQKIELINWTQRIIMVLDSKKHVLTPLPIDLLTLHFIRELVSPRKHGYVFIREGQTWTRVKADVALTKCRIWQIVREIAEKAGVEGFNPRDLRRAFAYEWHRKIKDKKSRKTMKGLQLMMRHLHQKTTDVYLDSMYSFEDLQREFDDAQETEKEMVQNE